MALPVKHALKTAIGAAILGAIFHESQSIAFVQYPAMGLVATMQSNLGGTVKAAWGRLGGSAVGGVVGALLLSVWGSNPLTAGFAFIIAMVICEACQFPTLSNQAGVIATLIASSLISLGDNPWFYAIHRVLDNGIGVVIGTAVTILFWPDNPRQTLIDNLAQVLSECDRLLREILGNCLQPEKSDCSGLISQIQNSLKQSEALLEKSLYGGIGRQLAQDNWSERLAIQRRLLRYLLVMDHLSKKLSRCHLGEQIKKDWGELQQQTSSLLNDLAIMVKSRQQFNQIKVGSAQERLQIIKRNIASFLECYGRDKNAFEPAITIYSFSYYYEEFVESLEALVFQLIEPKSSIKLSPKIAGFNLRPIPLKSFRYFAKVGIVIVAALAIVSYIIESSANKYVIIGIIIAMRPTLGKGIIAGRQQIICTTIGATTALIIINTLGNNYFTLSLGIILAIMLGSHWGFTEGYHTLSFPIIIALLTHSNTANPYLASRIIGYAIGIFIGVFASLIWNFDTASNQLDQRVADTFKNLQKIYSLIIKNSLEGLNCDSEIKKQLQEIRQSILIQKNLYKETEHELFDSLLTSRKQRLWNFLLGWEAEIFRHLFYLHKMADKQNKTMIPQSFKSELQNIIESTLKRFDLLILAVEKQRHEVQFSLQLGNLEKQSIERQILTSIDVPLSKQISFSALYSTLSEISISLEQAITYFPKS